MPDAAPTPTLADLGLLVAAIDHDQQRPVAQRELDDKAFHAANPTPAADDLATLRRWAAHRAGAHHALGELARRAAAAEALMRVLSLALGLAVGVLLALGVFYYDGSARINVLAVLAVFVFLPLALLLLVGVAMLPMRVAEALPGVGPLAELLRGLSVGRVVRGVMHLLPQSWRDSLAWSRGAAGKHAQLYAEVEKWSLLTASQAFASALSFAAIITLLLLVVFSDLAFGWSTTLDISPARFHELTQGLALPWSWTARATPSLELVESSRYFRLATNEATPEDARALGGWWGFVVMSMVVYGLLPRLVVWYICHARQRAAIRAALLTTPGAPAVLRRLSRAAIHTASPEAELGAHDTPGAELSRSSIADADAVIIWADAPRPSSGSPHPLAAGGSRTIAEDRAVLASLGQRDPRPSVALYVKAWEPPMLELLDFLRDLRQTIGQGAAITVVPTGDASAEQHNAWHRKLTTLSDPWLSVAARAEP